MHDLTRTLVPRDCCRGSEVDASLRVYGYHLAGNLRRHDASSLHIKRAYSRGVRVSDRHLSELSPHFEKEGDDRER